eukprot:c34971_g1_i1 orf=58-243(-)
MCWTIVEHYSNLIMVFPCKHTTITKYVSRSFIKFWYPIYGLPQMITSSSKKVLLTDLECFV